MWSEHFEYKNRLVFITAVNHAAIGITCSITIDGVRCHSSIAAPSINSLKAAIDQASDHARQVIDAE